MTLALDFGTCNTILARWCTDSQQIETLRLGNFSKVFAYKLPHAKLFRQSAVIPTLIHYGEQNNLYIGAQVEIAGLTEHKSTFRWLKLDILKGNNQARRIHGEFITPRQAADELIEQMLMAAGLPNDEDLVITVPVEAYDQYLDWLLGSVQRTFQGTVHVLDEASACLLGYDIPRQADQIYVVFDFGGGTLDVSVIKLPAATAAEIGPPRILGRAGEELGGSLVDQWLLAELQQNQCLTSRDVADVGMALLRNIETAKIRLSNGEEQVMVEQWHEQSARLITHVFNRHGLQQLLAEDRADLGGFSLYRLLSRTVERAMEQAQDKYGVKKSVVKAVLMAGGSSLLLGVAEVLRHLFPDSAVHCENPYEAIARGACRYAGENINLTLVHDYCLESWNRDKRAYELVVIIPKGSRYPSERPLTKKYLNAACDGATRLGLVVKECAAMICPEPVYQMQGGVLSMVDYREEHDTALRELNPKDREFIHADPPCNIGERRFIAGFGIDANRRLTLSLKDLHSGSRSYVQLSSGEKLPLPIKDLPFVKL